MLLGTIDFNFRVSKDAIGVMPVMATVAAANLAIRLLILIVVAKGRVAVSRPIFVSRQVRPFSLPPSLWSVPLITFVLKFKFVSKTTGALP